MINIRKLEKELWEAADLLRSNSEVTSQEYCMPVLGLIFLRYAYSRFKFVEADILKNRPVRNGRVMPVEAADFKQKSAIFLPREAQYDYLVNLPDSEDVGKAIKRAMELIEDQSEQLKGILPKDYTNLKNDLLRELLRIFNNSAFNDIQDDVIGRIYEYFLNKFAPVVASDDGVFFTPKSLVRMIVNIIEPTHGTVLDPACGSGGMFVSSADFIEKYGAGANTAMTFYGQEKLPYNAKLCVMNMAVHGLNAKILSGDEANSFYKDAHSLVGCCDYVMANPPFNVDKVKSEDAINAGRLPLGLPGINSNKEFSNANYLWINYFYAYLNETGRAGFVMPSSATDSQGKDKDIRKTLLETNAVDVMISVGNNFFYTKSLPCTLWFFDKAKRQENKDKVLFIDARNYYTVVDKTLNEWSEWQMKNLNAIVWLYRGEVDKYKQLIKEYITYFKFIKECLIGKEARRVFSDITGIDDFEDLRDALETEIILEKEDCKEKLAKALKKDQKHIKIESEQYISLVQSGLGVVKEAIWLTEKFGNGEYKDVSGLCYLASANKTTQKDDGTQTTINEFLEKGYSFTPGAYVGVEAVADDGVDFETRMKEIHAELLTLQAQSNDLMATISANLKELEL